MDSISENLIQKWLELAKWAPSGGNAQPWTVEYEENKGTLAIRLSIDEEYRKHPSLMDVQGTASAVALGCFFKNFDLAAQNDQFVLVNQKWEQAESIWDNRVVFYYRKSDALVPSRFSNAVLQERHTDRYPYQTKPLADEDLKALRNILSRHSSIKKSEIHHGDRNLLQLLSDLESIRWQHEGFLKSLMSEIGFDPSEKAFNQKIPVTQLGVSFPDMIAMRLIKRFLKSALGLFGLGLYRIPVRQNTVKFVKDCDRIFLLQSENLSFKSCFELGACLQELWLEASSRKISAQINGNGLLALAYWQEAASLHFTAKQSALLESATEGFQKAFDLDLKKIVLGIRFGYPKRSSEKSPRQDVRKKEHHGLITP